MEKNVLPIDEFILEGLLLYSGSDTLAAHMTNWVRQGTRRWKPHGIILPADEVRVPLIDPRTGRPPGHSAV